MELLIPGLILVGLMIYASTRIKRTAAAAFEPETVETDEFVIQKPEGFLNVIGGDEKYAFEAYSKDYGDEGTEEFRQGRAFLTRTDKAADMPAGRKNKRTEVIDGVHYDIFETTRREKEAELIDQYKIGNHKGRSYEFRTVRLANAPHDMVDKLENMLESFRLKQ